MLDRGETTSQELTELFLSRIERLDPSLNAFRVVFAELARRGRPGRRPPPQRRRRARCSASRSRSRTTRTSRATSPRWAPSAVDEPARADSEVVRRLRAPGGDRRQDHVPEMMIVPFTESPTFGVTRNPWDLAAHAGRLERRLGGRRRRRPRARRRWAPTAAARSASPPRAAGCSASSPSAAASRSRRWSRGTASRSGADHRRVGRQPRFFDADRDGGPSPGRLGRASPDAADRHHAARPAGDPGDGRRRAARRARQGTADLLRSLGHEVVERDFPTGTTRRRFLARYLRGVADEAREMPFPERLAPHAGLPPPGRLIPDPVLERARAEEANAAAIAHRLPATPTC